MFQYRTSNFAPSVAAIQKHLGAVETELEKIGRIAGRQTSDAAAAASDQIGDAISTILNQMVDRFRKGGQAAGDQAGRLSNQALDLGAKYGTMRWRASRAKPKSGRYSPSVWRLASAF
jgi:hypothetical protein